MATTVTLKRQREEAGTRIWREWQQRRLPAGSTTWLGRKQESPGSASLFISSFISYQLLPLAVLCRKQECWSWLMQSTWSARSSESRKKPRGQTGSLYGNPVCRCMFCWSLYNFMFPFSAFSILFIMFISFDLVLFFGNWLSALVEATGAKTCGVI